MPTPIGGISPPSAARPIVWKPVSSLMCSLLCSTRGQSRDCPRGFAVAAPFEWPKPCYPRDSPVRAADPSCLFRAPFVSDRSQPGDSHVTVPGVAGGWGLSGCRLLGGVGADPARRGVRPPHEGARALRAGRAVHATVLPLDRERALVADPIERPEERLEVDVAVPGRDEVPAARLLAE